MDRFILCAGMKKSDSEYWFLSMERSELFCLNTENNCMSYISTVPDADGNWRWNSLCIRVKNAIICVPYNGEFIWKYDMDRAEWDAIHCDDGENEYYCTQLWEKEGKVYIYSKKRYEIWVLDVENNSLDIRALDTEKESNRYGEICIYDDGFLVPLTNTPSICIYDRNMNLITEKALLSTGYGNNICVYSEGYIWLAGYTKNIIKINLSSMEETILHLPSDFGIYSLGVPEEDRKDSDKSFVDTNYIKSKYPLFMKGLYAGGKIWFVPLFSNKLVYVDVSSNEVSCFEIEHETENKLSMNNRIICGKYLLEYVENERYIGLFSIKNEWIVEIDAYDMTYKIKEYDMDLRTYSFLHQACGYRELPVEETIEYGLQTFIEDTLCPKRKFAKEIASYRRLNF
jgi:hypothetical protein